MVAHLSYCRCLYAIKINRQIRRYSDVLKTRCVGITVEKLAQLNTIVKYMEMKIVTKKITRSELQSMAEAILGDMVKAVVDVEKRIMAVGGEMHADMEQLLISNGSQQHDIWGINLYPNDYKDNFIEYTSLINIRPQQGNRSMDLQNQSVRDRIKEIVTSFIA